ncbi:bactofilin family protein [Geosporobacter ferrireducens]|uniref:Cell shape determination protein CcmA n=1 Tax=Geosporobacter ferrireducens TaxID=1424294 RepID=A0A1D8GP98_9FIRM|nr:polymer-forming cytoskeletal protein [Geosporobacter ferrireducens]AOT72687.1 cell shape determination protein CcmA [Geosporobacter ferrireducens]MTI55096.1 polymer-forming cytoskeletal protein [Geosporobacter ferrireducens]
MFKKNDVIPSEKIDTFVGKNSSFEGVLQAEGTIRIDGAFKGDLQIKGNVIIGEEGKIVGNIDAHNIILAGSVEGNITASHQLKINTTGKLYGDIQVSSFVVEEKAIFEGTCKMKDSPVQDKNIISIKNNKTAKA